MKTSILATLLVLSTAAVPALAEEAPRLNYKIDKIIPGYSAGLIEAGYVLGALREDTSVPMPPAEQSAQKVLSNESEKRSQEIQQSAATTKAMQREFLNDSGHATIGNASNATANESAVAQAQASRLDAFIACAREALPKLKAAYAAELRGKQLESRRILQALDSERGDESGANPAGMACGSYLGTAATGRPSLLEEIKTLAALAAREGTERAELFQAFVASNHSESKGSVKGLWTYYWKSLAPIAALTLKPLTPLVALRDELLATPASKFTRADGTEPVIEVKFAIKPETLKTSHEDGLQFARDKLTGEGS